MPPLGLMITCHGSDCYSLGLMDLALVPRPDPALGPGLGLVAQIMFGCGPCSGLVKMIAIKYYLEHFGRSRAIFFSQRKSYW
jgi:hypothetical protein